jgi:Putative adhesin
MTTTLIRRAGVLVLVAAATTTLTGCAGVIGATMTYHDTEKGKITDIVVAGGAGDVVVTTGPVTETTITRVVRRSSNPGEAYRLDGTTLTIDGSCGMRCSVSYQIKTAPGVAVRGKLGSGDMRLDGVGAADVEVSSGDLAVTNATGPVQVTAASGNLRVHDAKAAVRVRVNSGDAEVINPGGGVTAEVGSGNLNVVLAKPHSVTAETGSGDIDITVPAGDYRVVTRAGSGDVSVQGVTDKATAANVLDLKAASGNINVTSGA